MLSNAYFLAKFRFDTAENEPAKNLQNFRKIHFRKMHFSKNAFSKSAFSKNRPRSRRGVSTSACMRTRTTSSMKALSPQPMRGAPHAVKIATRFASKVCFKWEAWNMNLVPPESTNLHIYVAFHQYDLLQKTKQVSRGERPGEVRLFVSILSKFLGFVSSHCLALSNHLTSPEHNSEFLVSSALFKSVNGDQLTVFLSNCSHSS